MDVVVVVEVEAYEGQWSRTALTGTIRLAGLPHRGDGVVLGRPYDFLVMSTVAQVTFADPACELLLEPLGSERIAEWYRHMHNEAGGFFGHEVPTRLAKELGLQVLPDRQRAMYGLSPQP